jgi:excisionase family DNA binding protein
METRYLTTKEVAKRLSVTSMSVNRWIRSGRLRAYRFSQNAYRINQDDLNRFIENSATIPKKDQVIKQTSDSDENKEEFSTARSLMKFAGTWKGPKEEYEAILKFIEESQKDTEF